MNHKQNIGANSGICGNHYWMVPVAGFSLWIKSVDDRLSENFILAAKG